MRNKSVLITGFQDITVFKKNCEMHHLIYKYFTIKLSLIIMKIYHDIYVITPVCCFKNIILL